MKHLKLTVATLAAAFGLLANPHIVAQDYDEQDWWNPGDWFDDTPNYWNDTREPIDRDFDYSERYDDYTPYSTVRDDDGQSAWNMTDDWFTDDYWDNRFQNDPSPDTTGWTYDDSAWGYDENYWNDTWD